MDLELKDKVVLVTGASKGIGRAIAEAFAAEGARVALNARGEGELGRAVDAIRQKGGEAFAARADLTKAEDVERMVRDVAERCGTIHVLVNNAGGVGSFSRFDELSDEDWRAVMELNLFSAVRVTRAVLPYMRRQKWGRIISIASESGRQPDPEMAHYNASKAALINLTKSLSKAYASEGVLVNVVSPAFIMTPLVAGMLEEQARALRITPQEAEARFIAEKRPHIELRRPGRPEEVASAVVFLASGAASFINGSELRVDGGSVASL